MRIRLSDGTIVGSDSTIPSKRTTKNGSGRGGRRAYNQQQVLLRAGGTTNITRAIYHGADPHNEDGVINTNYAPLCRVVNPRTKTFTDTPSNPGTDLGGKGI